MRVAECCCTTKRSGPSRFTSAGLGSGVASNLRLAEYSLSFFPLTQRFKHVKKLLAGASGYSFKEWKGDFYPADMKPEGMLGFYCARLPTVEINNTFYRMPRVEMLENWAHIAPEGFRFAIKASRRITHISRIKDSAKDSVDYLYKNLGALGE